MLLNNVTGKRLYLYFFHTVFPFLLALSLSLSLYIASPKAGEYSAVIFERCVLMLENTVCAFTFSIVFLFIIEKYLFREDV